MAFLEFLPKFIGALIIFLIGWFLAVGIGKLITKVLNIIKLNQLFSKGGWDEAMEKAGIKADVSGFIGAVCKWVLVIVFLLAAVEVLGLGAFAGFLSEVIAWLPNVIIAVIILVVAVIIADITEKIVKASVQKVKVGFANMAGAIVKWSIYVFAVLAILLQLGITPYLIQLLLTGLVAMLALAAGLAFGLGGKDAASEAIDAMKKKIKD
jgi:hypothetical protein